MTDKTCIKCGNEKPIDEFYSDKRQPDKRQSWCKTCVRIAASTTGIRQLSPEELEKAQHLHASGVSLRLIGKLLGRSHQAIGKSLRMGGISTRTPGSKPGAFHKKGDPVGNLPIGNVPKTHGLAEVDAAAQRDRAWADQLDARREAAKREMGL